VIKIVINAGDAPTLRLRHAVADLTNGYLRVGC
jgi:hypothetical protein